MIVKNAVHYLSLAWHSFKLIYNFILLVLLDFIIHKTKNQFEISNQNQLVHHGLFKNDRYFRIILFGHT